jgi:hypothetical protein
MGMTGPFYMTYARSRPNWIPAIASGDYDIRLIGGELDLIQANHSGMPLLTNAMHRWSDAQSTFLDPFEYETRRVLDSGGYNVQAQFVDRDGNLCDECSRSDIRAEIDSQVPFFPWSVKEYHDWLCENADSFAWAAVMDYACEDRFNTLWDYEDRVEATVENTIRHFDLHSGEYELLPVLQGRSADDYVECYDRLLERGIPVQKVGLGTVCRLSSSREIVDLEDELRRRRDFDHIHGFGVKRDSFSRGAGFESADSQAWVWDASHGKENVLRGGSLISRECDNSLRRTVVSFREYYRFVQSLRTGDTGLPPLRDDSQATQTTLSDGFVAATDGGETHAHSSTGSDQQ